ncbi:MAG: DUF5018 domain-containing protein [Prevotellaceae bacterium]|jgi:hypothetical protein|nr:DUF5018 domain-containing protein [Prevotellaceae bacterium]
MKSILKYMLMALLAGYAFAACSKDDKSEPSKSAACEIVSFSVNGDEWTIEGGNITRTYPAATAETALTPLITLSPGAEVDPPANRAQNFFAAEGVAYTVTAEDGKTTKTYTAKATKELPPVDPVTGLTEDIQDLVPQEIISTMKDLGQEINGGNTPPTVEGTYELKPLILKGSNIDSDRIGSSYLTTYITFSEQDNGSLTLKAKETQGTRTATGTGAFIVGEGNRFSVFIYFTNYRTDINTSFKTVGVYSGTVSPDGIIDCTTSLFMLDDGGDPEDGLIENGDGRVLWDSDGLAERVEPPVQEQSVIKPGRVNLMNSADKKLRVKN